MDVFPLFWCISHAFPYILETLAWRYLGRFSLNKTKNTKKKEIVKLRAQNIANAMPGSLLAFNCFYCNGVVKTCSLLLVNKLPGITFNVFTL